MAKLTNMIEGRTTDSGNLFFKREIAVKFNAKIATTSRWIKMIDAESNGGRSNLERCRSVPIRRYSVLDGLTESRLEVNQS